ncbi:hypothetical protein GYH30_054966 [Glycine max]|nr:hypothetical protein GYH30_054966 [Glycine max]
MTRDGKILKNYKLLNGGLHSALSVIFCHRYGSRYKGNSTQGRNFVTLKPGLISSIPDCPDSIDDTCNDNILQLLAGCGVTATKQIGERVQVQRTLNFLRKPTPEAFSKITL